MNKPFRYGVYLWFMVSVIVFGMMLFFLFLGSAFGLTGFKKVIIIFSGAIFAGFFITAFILITTPVFKDYLITFRRLLRLENLSHPLLLKLSLEAPGSYHHSLNVATLAHRAAKAIGADPLLARVGAYYHDIGKISHPEYFVENQQGVNPHDELNNPQQSAQIIIDHIKEGIKISQENQLPQEIVDFIPQHHGTTIAQYFYQKSKDSEIKIPSKYFRYPGPKPLRKETAIVMLADLIEAKIRSFPKVDQTIINEEVAKVIDEKQKEHQLELSGLTVGELTKIKTAFIETISQMHHPRIKYPQKNEPSSQG